MSSTVLVTGASGFIGSHVIAHLLRAGFTPRVLTRGHAASPNAEVVHYDGFDDISAIQSAVQGASAVVHLAARVHVMREHANDPLAAFRAVNTAGTRTLANAAADAGVRTFLFASSVKAVGEGNAQPWTEDVTPAPRNPYGVSKLEAERALMEITRDTGMSTISVRMPLVYGPGVRANFMQLFRWVDGGIPLPLKGVQNRRSMIYVENVAAAFVALVERTAGAEVFFASDGTDLSTTELIQRIAAALNRRARLFHTPVTGLRLAGRIGDSLARLFPFPVTTAALDRLFGSLSVDSSRLRQITGPLPFSVEQGLAATAQWYRGSTAQAPQLAYERTA
jgi:nucleoside-diphosphate-sugar epimerase